MSNQPLSWSEERQERLQEHLTGEWLEDTWVFIPVNPKGKRSSIHFTLTSPSLKLEVKYAVWNKFANGIWNREKELSSRCPQIHLICKWLNHFTVPIHSLMEQEVEHWEISLRLYLVQQGLLRHAKTRHLLATQKYTEFVSEDTRILLFRSLYTTIYETYDDRTETEKDIWNLQKMGLTVNLTNSSPRLDFTRIPQLWLRHLSKEFLKYRISVQSPSDGVSKLNSLVEFSRFLTQYNNSLLASDINRHIVVNFIHYLNTCAISDSYRRCILSNIRIFLETCTHLLHISEITKEQLIFEEDFPKSLQSSSRELPDEVLEQLRKHLHTLPTTLLRMVTILLECGLRCSELCSLPLDCLICDDKHEWCLRFFQIKLKQEYIIPLVNINVIKAIQAQQQEVREQWGTSCSYLFPSLASPTFPFKQATFRQHLNQWAYETNISDAIGKLFRLQPHQFRHTVGMRLINEDVPLDVISRLLGHHSLTMTQVYARKRIGTLREELQRSARKHRTINYQGQTVRGDARANNAEVQLIRQGIRGQTLPVGGCGRLIVRGACPHANTCLTCDFWLTSTDDLPALKIFHQKAMQLQRRAQQVNNLVVLRNQEVIIPLLARRIIGLENEEDDISLSAKELSNQLRADLAEAQVGLEEVNELGFLLSAKRLEKHILELQTKIDDLENTMLATKEEEISHNLPNELS